ncbi:MAG: hypothetical protein HC859_16650 [Bacteroidia bacterium]|nr:hypothetical protein [Bacteroidia bacterium]
MRPNQLLQLVFAMLAATTLHAQKKSPEPVTATARQLYLTRIQAAEALLQLGEMTEAKEVLNAIAPGERNLEWTLLNGMSDRSVKTVRHHRGSVAAVAVSPDGQLVATGSADSTIVVWKFPSFDKVQTFKGHLGQVSTLDFSPDGTMLVSGSTDKTVKLWDIKTAMLQKLLRRLLHGEFTRCASAPTEKTCHVYVGISKREVTTRAGIYRGIGCSIGRSATAFQSRRSSFSVA